MTRDQMLADIRERARVHKYLALVDVKWLLAEIERLKAELKAATEKTEA